MVSSVAHGICLLQVQGQRNDIGNGREGLGEHVHQPFVVVVRSANLQATNLSQTLQSHISELGLSQESGEESVDDRGFENVSQRDPVQKSKKSFEGRFHQTRLVCSVKNLGAQLEDRRKFRGHGGLQIPCLGRSHLILRKIEDFLRQQTENCHVVLTDRKAGMTRRDDLVDEGGPVVRPFLLQNGDENEIELVQ